LVALRNMNQKFLLTVFIAAICGLNCSKQAPATDQPAGYAAPSYMLADSIKSVTGIHFTDMTRDAGIDFVHETGAFGKKWMPETMGSGGGFLDYDNDSWSDIFLVNGCDWPGHERQSQKATPKLYRNLGNGRFEDVTRKAGLDFSIYGMGCAFADYDADGDMDIYLTAVGNNKLLRNGQGQFRDVTAQTGASGNSEEPGRASAWSTSAAWADVNRDGWLDMFVCNYVRWTPATDLFTTLDGKNKSYATPEQYEGESCRLYRNIRGLRFEDITKRAGVLNHNGKSLGVAVADFNDDGWPDIVVANDTQPNFLYQNNGDGTFTDIGLPAGIAYDEVGRARAGMGIDVADINNQGKQSIAIGNFSREPLSLYTQIGHGLFQDLAGATHLARPSLFMLTFGLTFADFDLDGFADLITANGHIEPEINSIQPDITFAQPPQLFLNNRAGQFIDVSQQIGEVFPQPVVARGLATADIDGDGDLDVLITVNGGPAKLLRNDLPGSDSSNWIKFRLIGKPPNRNAIGAAVTVSAGDLHQRKTIRTGSSYLSQSDISVMIFGLGSHTQADSIEIRWPTSGRVDKLGSARAGRFYEIDEKNSKMKALVHLPK